MQSSPLMGLNGPRFPPRVGSRGVCPTVTSHNDILLLCLSFSPSFFFFFPHRILRKFHYLLNPKQVFNLDNGGPTPGYGETIFLSILLHPSFLKKIPIFGHPSCLFHLWTYPSCHFILFIFLFSHLLFLTCSWKYSGSISLWLSLGSRVHYPTLEKLLFRKREKAHMPFI